MKKLLIAAAMLTFSSTAAYASSDGMYAGLQLGYGDQGYDVHHAFIPFSSTGTPSTDISPNGNLGSLISGANALFNANAAYSSDVDASGFAGRIFGGYQFNPNLAAEMGYAHFADTQTKANISSTVASLHPLFSLNNTIKEQAVDVVGKMMYPMCNNTVSIYTKLGAAWVNAEQDTDLSYKNNDSGNIVVNNINVTNTTDPIRPIFGAGISYDLNQNVSLDASWTRIEGNNLIQNIDFYGAGLTYHFA